MTPEDHYVECERLLKMVDEQTNDWKLIWAGLVLQEAQVHATLAGSPGAVLVTS